MAKGDAVNGIATVAANGYLYIQPTPAGVEYMILGIASELGSGTTPNATPQASLVMFKSGVSYSTFCWRERQEPTYMRNRVLVTNSVYGGAHNGDQGSSRVVAWWGIQTK